MSTQYQKLAERYGKILATYVGGAGEAALQSAYEIGRQAVQAGLGCLDIAQIHEEALIRSLLQASTLGESSKIAKLGSDFLAQSLSPYEMTHRGFQEVILDLSRRAVELATVNRRLETEISERRRVESALQQETSYVKLLNVVTVAANMGSGINDAYRRCLEEVCLITGWPIGHVYIVDEDSPDRLVPTSIWHLAEPKRFEVFRHATESLSLSRGIGLPGRVFSTGESTFIVDLAEDSNFLRAQACSEVGIRSGFAFPILVGSEVVAVLEFFSDLLQKPDEQLLDVMAQIGIQLGRVVERRRSEDVLREIPKRILEAQEAERRRVAHELHDDVCQRLSATKLHIGAFENEIPEKDRKVHSKLQLIKRQINANIQEVRRIAAHLRPTTLDDMGLHVALRLLCEEFQKINHTRANFKMKARSPQRLDPPVELTLYRIAQEGLSNVAKHAEAKTVSMRLMRLNGIIRLDINDNGRGFEIEKIRSDSVRGYKLGLLSMKERAELLNGTCRIESVPGKGTKIRVEIPLESNHTHGKD